MKKLNISLSDISGKDLSEREKLSLRGGEEPSGICCQCGCCYEGGSGGADSDDNMRANFQKGLYSPCIPEGSTCMLGFMPGGDPYTMDWCGIIPGGGDQ